MVEEALDPGSGSTSGWPVPWQPVWGEADGLGSRLGAWAARAALGGAALLPEPMLRATLGGVAWLGTTLDRRRSRAAQVFLRQALGDLPEHELRRLTRRSWAQLLRVSVDMERLRRVPGERLGQRFEVRYSGDTRRAFEEARGRVIVTGHLGNWEAPFAALPLLGVSPAYGVAKPPKNRFLSQALQERREAWGVRVLSRKGAMADAPSILRAGGTLALVVDQRTSGRALLVPFFGRLARCERAPAVLLKRQRVPVVVATCRAAERPLHWVLEYHETLWPEQWGRRSVEEIVLAINQALERCIRRFPEQYVWIHDRYRGTPLALEEGSRPRVQRGPPAGRAREE